MTSIIVYKLQSILVLKTLKHKPFPGKFYIERRSYCFFPSSERSKNRRKKLYQQDKKNQDLERTRLKHQTIGTRPSEPTNPSPQKGFPVQHMSERT